jgi:hypothetical protein
VFKSDCNEASQEWSLGYVDVYLRFDIFQMTAIAMVTMKVKTFFLIKNFKTLNIKLAMGFHKLSLFRRLCSREL